MNWKDGFPSMLALAGPPLIVALQYDPWLGCAFLLFNLYLLLLAQLYGRKEP